MIEYMLCLVLFSIGLYCVLRKRNIIKIILGIGIMEYAVNLFFILTGYVKEGRSPIFASDHTMSKIVDPLTQTVVLTAIVIGLALTLLLVAMAIKIY